MQDDSRFTKIDDAIQRLASVSADLSKILAVQEHRLNQQEKILDRYGGIIEKGREDLEARLKLVYDTIHIEDDKILHEIAKSSTASLAEYAKLEGRFVKIEKMIWMACGGGVAIGWITHFVFNYFKVVAGFVS